MESLRAPVIRRCVLPLLLVTASACSTTTAIRPDQLSSVTAHAQLSRSTPQRVWAADGSVADLEGTLMAVTVVGRDDHGRPLSEHTYEAPVDAWHSGWWLIVRDANAQRAYALPHIAEVRVEHRELTKLRIGGASLLVLGVALAGGGVALGGGLSSDSGSGAGWLVALPFVAGGAGLGIGGIAMLARSSAPDDAPPRSGPPPPEIPLYPPPRSPAAR